MSKLFEKSNYKSIYIGDVIKVLAFKSYLDLNKPKKIYFKSLNKDIFKIINSICYDEKSGKYEINFNLTGFDRDPLTSLIVECKKQISDKKNREITYSKNNYNRYGLSLLKDKEVKNKLDKMNINYPKVE